jgi:CRP-like cAMP-binding protein
MPIMTKDKLIKFVRHVLPMPLGKAQELVERFQEKEVSKNDYILREGHVCKESCFIEEGLMRAYTYDVDGNDVTTAFYAAGEYAIDIFSFFKQVPSKENIQALTDCKIWSMGYEDMQISFHTLPEFREFGRLNITNHYGLLKQRMLSMIQETADQRYANLMRSNPEILRHAPLKHIASYLGITDTSLSRIRKDLVKK